MDILELYISTPSAVEIIEDNEPKLVVTQYMTYEEHLELILNAEVRSDADWFY